MRRRTCRPQGIEAEKRNTGFLSMLAERFRESAVDRAQPTSLIVLPFTNMGADEVAPLYGFALADAIAARLARIPALVVRPSSTLMQLPIAQMDPLTVGQRLLVSFVLAGSFLRSAEGFDLNWQLLDVQSQSVRSGGAIRVASLDLIAVQAEISNEVFASLHGLGAGDQMDAPQSWNSKGRRQRRGARFGQRRIASRPSERGLSAGAGAAELVHGSNGFARRSRSRTFTFHSCDGDRSGVCGGLVRAGHCGAAICAPWIRRADSCNARAARF